MFSSFKGPANIRDKQPVFETFGERQFANFDETKHAPAPVWNIHSQAYNNVRIYPDQLNVKLQTLTTHNQSVIPDQRTSGHNNSLPCPYPNNNQTVVRPTAVINCHPNGTSCCGHPNRVPHHWNTVPPNVPPARHFVDNISLYNNHSNLNSEDYRFRTDTYYAPINKQILSHRDNPVVNQPSFYSGPLRNVPGLPPPYDVKLPTPLTVANRAVGKYAGNKGARTEPCAKCSGNCSENCELYGGQDVVDYSSADTPNEFARENMSCYAGLHSEPAAPATQYCTQWATNTSSQTDYCRQSNNTAMWMHNSHSAISGNNLTSNCWIEKKDLIPGNCLSQYASHHPSVAQQNIPPKDSQDSLKPPEMRVSDVSCMQAPQLINGYPEVLHQEKEKIYNGNFCNHIPGRRVDETLNKANGPFFKEKEVMNSQTNPQFAHLKQIKHHDFSLNGAPSMPQERLIFQESQTFTSSMGSHPISVPAFAQPNVLHPYHKNTTKSCFQNAVSGQLHAQDVTANSFSLCKVTEAFTTGIAEPPSRFSSHLTYTQSRISKASNEYSYFQDYDSSSHLTANSGTAIPAIPSAANSQSPKMNPVSSSACVSGPQNTFPNSDDSKIITNTSRNEHHFNRNADYSISDLQSCKRLQENNITGKLMQVIDSSTSNVNIGIRECTDVSSNVPSNIMLKNISSYSSEYNAYSGNVPSGSGVVSFNNSTGNVDFPATQMLTNFDPYSKQFVLNAGGGPDVLSSSGPASSSTVEVEVAGSNKVIQPEFSTEKFYGGTANPHMKRNVSHVNDVMKSEYRTAHTVKQKCQKMGQLDVRQFLATWDEETEDVASPRLPDVVLSSNGTPLFVVECEGGNLSEISPVTTNSTNEETVQRSGVIVYEHIQPINTGNNITEHTHADHVASRSADGQQVNVTDESGTLENNGCILLGSSISETETIQSIQETSESDVNVKQHVKADVALADGHTDKKGNSLCLMENKSPVDSVQIKLLQSDSVNTATRETVSPAVYTKESISDLQSVHSKDQCLLAEKTGVSIVVTENNEEKQLSDVQETSLDTRRKTDSVSPGLSYDTNEPVYEQLNGGNKVRCESNLLSETRSGTKHCSDEVMTSRNNLDDIAVDAFEELTNGKRDESALKQRYNFSNDSTGTNTPDVYPYNSHQSNSKSDAAEDAENENDENRSGVCIENISTHHVPLNQDTKTALENIVKEGCAEQIVKETRWQNLCPLNYRTMPSNSQMKNKDILRCYDKVPAWQSNYMFDMNAYQSTTAMQSDSNIYVKSSIKCNSETVTLRDKKEVNSSCTSSIVTDKFERRLLVHNQLCALEIPTGIGKPPSKSVSSAKMSLISFYDKHTVMNRMLRIGIPTGNIVPGSSKLGVVHLSSYGNMLSAATATVNGMISVSCKCLFPKQSVSESVLATTGTKRFLLPVDLLLDRATMQLIRRKLFSGKRLKTHDHCIKGILDSSKNRFLTNDKTLIRKDVLQRSHHTQSFNERAHGSSQISATFSFASYAARNSPSEKIQFDRNYVSTIFGNIDETGLSLFFKHHSQDDNQGICNRIGETLETIVQQCGKGRACYKRQCLRPAISLSNDDDEKLGTQVMYNVSGYKNLPGVSNLPSLFINSDAFRDECVQRESGIFHDLETTSILFKISDYCASLWLHHRGHNNYTHLPKNVASIKFKDVLEFEKSSLCTRDEKNVSEFEAASFGRYETFGNKLLKNIQAVATTCTATTRSKNLLMKDQMCSAEEIGCVSDMMVHCNNSLNGNDDKLTLLFSIKNNAFVSNYQQILSKSSHHYKRDTSSNSRTIRKINDDCAKQEEHNNNGKPVTQGDSSAATKQIITEPSSQNQELLPFKSVFKEIDADCQVSAAFIPYKVDEDNSLISNKDVCNGVSHIEKGKNCFVMETPSCSSFLKQPLSGVDECKLPYNQNIITEKNPVLIHHGDDASLDSDFTETPNPKLGLNEMCSDSEHQVSGLSVQKRNEVGSKTQNLKLELADESEVVISSTSTFEEAKTGTVDCNFNGKAESLFLYEDELPCVESYVDADDVTVVSGTHDDVVDEENDIDVSSVVVYPESHANVMNSEENVGTHISSADVCSESDVITTAIISDDVCMNSNCVIISEDESPRQSPQNLLMEDIVPCSTQEEEFRHFSTECKDEYQNSTVSSTTHINELVDSNRVKTMTTVLLREDIENQNITTSDMHGDFSFFGEEVDYYNTGVLQADSVSDWPYLEEEVVSEFQNSDVEPDVPLGNTTCERNLGKSQPLSCTQTTLNTQSMKDGLQCQNVNMEESSSCSKRNSVEENCKEDSNEVIDLKCRLRWDKIFNLPRKDKYSSYKMENRIRKTVTKSWPYYCKTQSRWKWPKSKDKLYMKMSKKPKKTSLSPEAKKQKSDFTDQCLGKDSTEISGNTLLDKSETNVHKSPANSSSLKRNMWHVTNGNILNSCGYKREKNNNYVVESVDTNSKSDVLSNPIVLVQRLILKRNRDHTDHGEKTRVNKNDDFPGYACNIEKSSCSDPYKREICKTDTLDSKNSTDVCMHTDEQSFVEIRGKQENIEDSYSSSISKCHDNNGKIFRMFKADSNNPRKKIKGYSVEVQHGKQSKEIKKPNDKNNSEEGLKELPRVIIKRSPDGSTRYKSFLCLSAATEKYWQPVVMLKRDSNIENLVKRTHKSKFPSHVMDESSQSNLEIPSEITRKVHKIKHKGSMNAAINSNNGNDYEWGAIDTCIASQKKIIRRKEKGDLSECKNSKYCDSNSLSISSGESFYNIIEANKNSDKQNELRSASVSDHVLSKNSKKYKGMTKHDKNITKERSKDNMRIYSECQDGLTNIELPSRRQSVEMFSDTEMINISASTPDEDNMYESKQNYHEFSHKSNNEERHSVHYSSSRHKILKKKFHLGQKLEKSSKKRHSEWSDCKSTTKKRCFWDSDYTKTVQVTSRSQQKFPDINVFSNEESHFPVHHRDEMATPNGRCSLIDQQVSLQNDKLEPYKSNDYNSVCQDGAKIDCQACGMELKNFAERSSHIRQHPYHCQRCHLAFKSEGDFVNHLSLEHPRTKEQHHCLLCEKSFTTSDKHQLHLQGRFHRYVELTQRRTIHTIFTLLTGRACPGLPSLTDAETEGLGWFPSEPGTVHFYHQATPLQMAVQGWLNYQRNKSECGIVEENKRLELRDHSQ